MVKIGGILNIMRYSPPVYENRSGLKCCECIFFDVIELDSVCMCCTFIVMHTDPNNNVCDYFYQKGKE